MKFTLFIFILFIFSGCQTFNSFREPNSSSLYETVNSVPQFADGENHFLFYWAVWRSLLDLEKESLKEEPGGLISQRNIFWQMQDCNTGHTLHQDGENIWYLDKIAFDTNGLMIPIKEAPRKGFLYFNMMNINSQHLRGAGPFKSPKKIRGETMDAWDKRRHLAFLDWLGKSWAKNSKGFIQVQADHRLFSQSQLNSEDSWISPKDYPKLTGRLLEIITRLSPKGWPVFFDERAHKAHLFDEPKVWQRKDFISQNRFRMKLVWDWCNPNEPVKVEVLVPKGELPSPGPNRPGRTDSGSKTILIKEIDWK